MKSIFTLLLVLISHVLGAEEIIDIWEGEPPYSKPNALEEYVKESWGVPCVHNVTHPTLTVYPVQGENSGRAMIVLPGGGYEVESFVAEGSEIAEYLAAHGITAAVLKYRLPLAEASDQPHLLPLTDARKAISLMKSMADTYGFDPSKVGIMGFSAGGHLAATASVLTSENEDEIPDFSALVYAVNHVDTGGSRRDWRRRLFHRADDRRMRIRRYSLARQRDCSDAADVSACTRTTTMSCRSANRSSLPRR